MESILTSKAESYAEKAESCRAFSGVKLLHIKTKVAEILGLIGRNDIFDEYTKHDISHINHMLNMLEWLIPDDTKELMKPADWLLIVLSIYFHDLGMLVTKKEFENRNNTDFVEYKNDVNNDKYGIDYKIKVNNLGPDKSDKFLYQEFVRSKHAERIKNWINGKNIVCIGDCEKIVIEMDNLLKNLDSLFRKDLGMICESHHLPDIDNFDKYKIQRHYGNTSEETANLHYAAIILRSADLLHITQDRTPTTEFNIISPTDPISQCEWYKQMAVKSVHPQPKKDKEGNVDDSLPKDTIEVFAYFDEPNKADSFFGLIAYLKYAKKELFDNNKYINESIKSQGSKYKFPWKDIDDSNIETSGFDRKLFEFNLDQAKILKLLIGHTLYNDTTVVLRELIQNSIDAVRLQQFLDQKYDPEAGIGNILIKWDSDKRILSFIDTGTGMTQAVIENNLLKVGASRYQDDDFRKKYPEFTSISRFGIGILTCFLVADDIDVATCSLDEEYISKLSIRKVDGKYLLQHLEKYNYDSKIKPHGTEISLHLRYDINMDDLENQIKKWVIFPPCSVELVIDDSVPKKIGYNSPRDAITSFLNDTGYNVDNINYKVHEETIDGVTMAYALEYHTFYKEWAFLERYSVPRNKIVPIGICIEGIRVEYNSPGFKGKKLLAVANCNGKNAPKTNVARSSIEINKEQDFLFKNIYEIYTNHVKNEISEISSTRGFSLTWATQEANYLIDPLLSKNDNSNNDFLPVDTDLFYDAINSIPFALIEKGNIRYAYSANDIYNQDSIWTVDCNLFRSAESLIKEASTSSSITSLIAVLYKDTSKALHDLSTILCGYSSDNILYVKAMSNKEVSYVKVFPDDRRVDMKWSNKIDNDNWLVLSVQR